MTHQGNYPSEEGVRFKLTYLPIENTSDLFSCGAIHQFYPQVARAVEVTDVDFEKALERFEGNCGRSVGSSGRIHRDEIAVIR